MYDSELKKYAEDILNSANFQRTKEHIQHGNMTVNEHCINVAKTSLMIKKKLHITCNQRDLVRGALLHDYFLYDWHDKNKPAKFHGFTHPKIAFENASRFSCSDALRAEKKIVGLSLQNSLMMAVFPTRRRP